MRVAENDGGDPVRRERKRTIVQFLFRLRALEQSTVDQNLSAFGFKPEARTGDRPRSTMKTQAKRHDIDPDGAWPYCIDRRRRPDGHHAGVSATDA